WPPRPPPRGRSRRPGSCGTPPARATGRRRSGRGRCPLRSRGSSDGYPSPDDEAAAVARATFERAPDDRDSLLHADESVAAARLPVDIPLAVILHLELELVGRPADGHPRAGRARVLESVRQRLLDDAVGGEIDTGGELLSLAHYRQLDWEPCLANRAD